MGAKKGTIKNDKVEMHYISNFDYIQHLYLQTMLNKFEPVTAFNKEILIW